MNNYIQKIKQEMLQSWHSNKKVILIGHAVAINIFVLDITSKFIIMDILRSVPRRTTEIIPDFLNFTEVWNFGVSFGMFSASTDYGVWILRVFTIMILIFLFYLHTISKPKLESYSLAIIIGGALGNIFDRLVHGAVYDFIDVVLLGWHFWTFNIADTAITIGAIGLVVTQIFCNNDNKNCGNM